jgi:hypothetical protein
MNRTYKYHLSVTFVSLQLNPESKWLFSYLLVHNLIFKIQMTFTFELT